MCSVQTVGFVLILSQPFWRECVPASNVTSAICRYGEKLRKSGRHLATVIEEKDPVMELRCLWPLGQVRQEHEIVSRMHFTCGVVGGCQWEAQGEVPRSHSHKLLRTVRLGRLWTIKFKMHCMSANMMTLAHWWAMLAVVSGMSHILPQPHHLPYWMADMFSSDRGFVWCSWCRFLGVLWAMPNLVVRIRTALNTTFKLLSFGPISYFRPAYAWPEHQWKGKWK